MTTATPNQATTIETIINNHIEDALAPQPNGWVHQTLKNAGKLTPEELQNFDPYYYEGLVALTTIQAIKKELPNTTWEDLTIKHRLVETPPAPGFNFIMGKHQTPQEEWNRDKANFLQSLKDVASSYAHAKTDLATLKPYPYSSCAVHDDLAECEKEDQEGIRKDSHNGRCLTSGWMGADGGYYTGSEKLLEKDFWDEDGMSFSDYYENVSEDDVFWSEWDD